MSADGSGDKAVCRRVIAASPSFPLSLLEALQDNPWLSPFLLDLALPSTVRGPVLRPALLRLASICRFEAIYPLPELSYAGMVARRR
jgi:hypothetical protein